MTRHALRLPLLLALLLASAPGARARPAPQAEPDPPSGAAGFEPARYEVRPATSGIEVDGHLDEPAWEDATSISLDFEWFPGDNAPAPVETEALVTFDSTRLYVAFRAHDPDPSAIRAHLMDRDSIGTFVQDDHVTLMVDPFNDQRRAFQFRINPLGVQADAVFSQVEFIEDFSWDIIWDSAGRITGEGYVVELAIPFNQLRFPGSGSAQTWGFELGRSYPRSTRHRISANRRNRNDNCILCQIDKITGFDGLEPGLNLEVAPTVTFNRTDERGGFPDGPLEEGDDEVEPGVTVGWGVTPNLTLDATLNPDFSQVEADAAQLEVNERFALFFPEKRPFFLEGIDLFTTPIDAVFTRTVVDPRWGAKLSGKQGVHAGGLFVTRDEVNSLVIPGNQLSTSAFLDQEVTGTVARYRRDVGDSSTLGVLYTGREGDDYHNRVGGLDGFVRLRPSDELRFQFLRSDTRYPAELADQLGRDPGSFDGDALRIAYNHTGRNWFWNAAYDDRDEGFRADSGFVPRVDVRTLEGSVTRRLWGDEQDWWTSGNVGLAASRTEDQDGRLTDEVVEVSGSVSGPLQSFVQLAATSTSRFFQGVRYDDLLSGSAFFEIQPSGAAKLSLFVLGGETVDFQNNQPADLLLLSPGVELKLGRHVNTRLDHRVQVLEVDGETLSETNLTELRAVYNLSVRSFVRAIFQYRDLEQTPELFDRPVEPEVDRLFTQLLFSYKLNPQTVAFVGYSDNRLGFLDTSLTQTDRTFFVKLGYAWLR